LATTKNGSRGYASRDFSSRAHSERVDLQGRHPSNEHRALAKQIEYVKDEAVELIGELCLIGPAAEDGPKSELGSVAARELGVEVATAWRGKDPMPVSAAAPAK
jgi:hypothetical protein